MAQLSAVDHLALVNVSMPLIVFNAEHLGRTLAKYASYDNEAPTHVSLWKDAPRNRPIERFGDVVGIQSSPPSCGSF